MKNAARRSGRSRNGPVVLIHTVVGSGACTDLVKPVTVLAESSLLLGSSRRSKLYLTSWEVSGEPSENLTPGRRWNVHLVSESCVHDCARSGCSFRCPS